MIVAAQTEGVGPLERRDAGGVFEAVYEIEEEEGYTGDLKSVCR